jgi:hypothetical protein
MHPCNYLAKTVRTWYHHHKFYPSGVIFDEEAVGQNWQGRGVSVLASVLLLGSFESFEYIQNFEVL